MSTPKYTVQRARVYVSKYGLNDYRDLNVVDAATYSFEEETITKASTNEVSGDVAKKTIRTSGTLTLTMGSTEFENFKLATRAKSSVQSAIADGAFTFPVCDAGFLFKLPATNINTVTLTGKQEGVDYRVLKNAGFVQAITANTAELAGTFTAGMANRAGIAAGAETEYTVVVDDILNAETTGFYKWSPGLPQNIALISPNEFGVYEVTGPLLLDETQPANGDLGQFGYKVENLAPQV